MKAPLRSQEFVDATRKKGHIVLGAGVGLLAVGLVTGYLSLSAADEARDLWEIETTRPAGTQEPPTESVQPVHTRAEITKLQQRLQTTCVYVTHDQVEAMTMGHRIAVMNAGKIQQVGTPLEVYDKPSNVFVAQFIGTPPMNFFDATVSDGQLNAAKFSIPVPVGQEVVLTYTARVRY